jgi:hypothetical protein
LDAFLQARTVWSAGRLRVDADDAPVQLVVLITASGFGCPCGDRG